MPLPLALLLSTAPSLTCLSTVIFESLVISAAWFRRSTTWKERERQVMVPAGPAPLALPGLCHVKVDRPDGGCGPPCSKPVAPYSLSLKWSCHRCPAPPLV